MKDFSIKEKLEDKGISNSLLLEAFQDIPEAFFLSETLDPNFYKDIITEESLEKKEPRVIVIARMLEQLQIKKEEKILITGVDSIYILVVLSKIYEEVYTVEANETYVSWVVEVLKTIGITNVHIKIGNPEIGWEEKGPFNAILIASEFEIISNTLKEQLKIGAKLLTPVSPDWAPVMLEIVKRVSEKKYVTKALRNNYIIPNPKIRPKIDARSYSDREIIDEIGISSIPFNTIREFPMDGLMERIGNARVVLLGEATHGTSEFYLTRQEITKVLIEKKGFNFVCAEADWSDSEQINDYVRNKSNSKGWRPFSCFPQWMWKNGEVFNFVEWLKKYNTKHNNGIGFYGLDLNGLEKSADCVIKYLYDIDPTLAKLAKSRYSNLTTFMSDSAIYEKVAKTNKLVSCEKEVLKILVDLLKNNDNNSQAYFHAYQNATVVINAERHYKSIYNSCTESWNLRDFHMFYTLQSLLSYFGKESKAVVWAHNSHIGNALATEMYPRGEINMGHLCKEHYGSKSYHIGFGTHTGTVAVAQNWGGKMEIVNLNNSVVNSYENLCNKTNVTNFTLPLRKEHSDKKLRQVLSTPRLQRAIGIVYKSDKEVFSHYLKTILPTQFDEYIWFNKTKAIEPIVPKSQITNSTDNHPLG